MKKIVSFDGYEPRELTEYSVEVSDVDAQGSGRSESGVMNRDRVRGGDDPVFKIDIGCTKMSDQDMIELLASLKPEAVQVNFFFGEYMERTMYAGNRKLSMRLIDDNETRWDVSASLTGY